MRLSLKTKFTLATSLLVLAVVAVVSALYLARLTRQTLRQSSDNADFIARAPEEVVDENRLVEISLASQIRNSEIDVQETKIELRRAEANAGRMLVKAPFDGIAVMQTIFRGGDLGQVKQGDQLWPGMMFMTIVDPRSMVINATVNQSDVERLRIGA